MRDLSLTLALGLLVGCSGGAATPPAALPDASSLPPIAAPPGADDPAWQVTLSRTWVLKADGLTAGDREVTVRIAAPADAAEVRAAVDDGPARAALRAPD
ncbi:MAG: hypothetical protein Q8S73_28090, partial [Deltaproteobacteria bacterium]|nr:hypothetical protein [Deltaproteobacteria bacterium]